MNILNNMNKSPLSKHTRTSLWYMNIYFIILNHIFTTQNKEGEVAAVSSNELLWFCRITQIKVIRLIHNASRTVFSYGFSTNTVQFSLDSFWDQRHQPSTIGQVCEVFWWWVINYRGGSWWGSEILTAGRCGILINRRGRRLGSCPLAQSRVRGGCAVELGRGLV